MWLCQASRLQAVHAWLMASSLMQPWHRCVARTDQVPDMRTARSFQDSAQQQELALAATIQAVSSC